MNSPDYDYMRDLEQRYQTAAGVNSRDDYSLFYGPLRRSPFVMINANPGGSPSNYRVVDVMRGEHEYVEGRAGSPTTRNGAEILAAILGSDDPERMRGVQVFNRFFRRSPTVPAAALVRKYMTEAAPFLRELTKHRLTRASGAWMSNSPTGPRGLRAATSSQ